jgi:predicted nuclease of predicted toxin-antitoxin system
VRLLFDQNLSFKLSRLLADAFPESNQIRLLGMEEADDSVIWEYAKANDFILVSQDADFADMATLFGPPPKVIWLCFGKSTHRRDRTATTRSRGCNSSICRRRSSGVLGNLLSEDHFGWILRVKLHTPIFSSG